MPNKLDAEKVTMAADVTQGGSAADARQFNKSVDGTFANEQNKKIENTYVLSGGTQIPENADLNDYKTFGNYYCNSNYLASGFLNCPLTNAFTMKVEDATGAGNYYIGQTIIDFFSGNRYYRVFNRLDGTWAPWHSFAGAVMQ